MSSAESVSSAPPPAMMVGEESASAAASRSRRSHLRVAAGRERAMPSFCCLLLVVLLLVLAPSTLFPSSPDLREVAERGGPSLAELGPFMQFTTVTRWGVLFATAGCPYNAPGTTGCSGSGAPAPFCSPNSCWSPQQPTECVIYCGSRGPAPYGGARCRYVQTSSPCQTCSGGSISNPMTCTPPGCGMGNPANGNAGSCGFTGSNTACNINCNGGYVVSGGSRRCGSGNWIDGAPTCEPAPCVGERVANSVGGCRDRTVQSGDSCNYVCDTGQHNTHSQMHPVRLPSLQLA